MRLGVQINGDIEKRSKSVMGRIEMNISDNV